MSGEVSSRMPGPSAWRRAAAAGADLLFPPQCAFCEAECRPKVGEPPLCADCLEALAADAGSACSRCAMPCTPADLARGKCGECDSRRLLFDEARALGVYQGAIREAVLKIKHFRHEPLAAALGKLLAQAIRERPFPQMPELVAPVSMHWMPRAWRGASAAETLAASLASDLGLRTARDLLVCRRWLRKQGTLLPSERRTNVRHAWRAARAYDIREARILVVDDVMTTGFTAHEAARALRQAGAGAVYVAVVARGTGQF